VYVTAACFIIPLLLLLLLHVKRHLLGHPARRHAIQHNTTQNSDRFTVIPHLKHVLI
jgi:hypothetical protein